MSKRISRRPQNTKPPLKVMYEGQVCPDGVVLNVNWDALQVGMSLFIPAINLVNLDKQVQEIARNRMIRLKGYERIEGGKLGIRFWRIL